MPSKICQLTFKRVVLIPATGKHEYRDTRFVARCKALSGVDCYNRVVDYLRQHVDNRSQFPSAKGKNFQFSYSGMSKQDYEQGDVDWQRRQGARRALL